MPIGENPTRLNAERNTGGPFPASASGERPRFQFRYDKYGVASSFTPGVTYQIFNLGVDPALIYRKFYFALHAPSYSGGGFSSPASRFKFTLANQVVEEWPFNWNSAVDNYAEKQTAPFPAWDVRSIDSGAAFGPMNIELPSSIDALNAYSVAQSGGSTTYYKIVMQPLRIVAEIDNISLQINAPVGFGLGTPPNIEFWIACISQNLPY